MIRKLRGLSKEVYKDYTGQTDKRVFTVKFKQKISKSPVYISKKTGCVFHKTNINTSKSLSIWENSIFSNSLDPKKQKYTANNPIMKSRHNYAANFLINFIGNNKKNIRVCDYGSGEGNFGLDLISLSKKVHYAFTEHSAKNFLISKKNITRIPKKNFLYGFKGSIEDSKKDLRFKNFDFATLLWTLCNTVDPINVLNAIYASLKPNSYLLVSESSRILVPFKKPIKNYFHNKHETNNVHPWHFSYNSISNLLEICGFRIVKVNRYYDENDLVIIAKKKDKINDIKIYRDDPKKIHKFFMEWEKFSKNFN